MAFGQSVVKSIQRGTISMSGTSNTATITAVDVDKSVVLWGGSDFGTTGGHESSFFTKLVLTNSTTVTASRVGSIDTCVVPFQVLEYS